MKKMIDMVKKNIIGAVIGGGVIYYLLTQHIDWLVRRMEILILPFTYIPGLWNAPTSIGPVATPTTLGIIVMVTTYAILGAYIQSKLK